MDNNISDGGAAFPGDDLRANGWQGMSLRDYFAGQALVGLLTNNSSAPEHGTIARLAYRHADAMLIEKSKMSE